MTGKGIVMRANVALLLAFAVVGCSAGPATRDSRSNKTQGSNRAVEFLLASAAMDFHTHGPARSVRFRNVRSGYLTASDGTPQYRLCGEFVPAEESGRAEWTKFATIKTSGYEQYLGAGAASYCGSSVTWDEGDLSSSLQSRLDSLR